MRICSTTVSLNVDDVLASSAFLVEHFGFNQDTASEGFASLTREDAGMHVVFLRRGQEMLPPVLRQEHARGVVLAFVVDDLEGELARLKGEGVAVGLPPAENKGAQRSVDIEDPNGVVLQLVEWHERPLVTETGI